MGKTGCAKFLPRSKSYEFLPTMLARANNSLKVSCFEALNRERRPMQSSSTAQRKASPSIYPRPSSALQIKKKRRKKEKKKKNNSHEENKEENKQDKYEDV